MTRGESQPDALLVDVVLKLDIAEELKHVLLVLLAYAEAIVGNADAQVPFLLVFIVSVFVIAVVEQVLILSPLTYQVLVNVLASARR